MNTKDADWNAIHPDGSPFPGETHPVLVALATGEPIHGVAMGVTKPDGNIVWIRINAVPVPGSDGLPESVIASFADVTDHHIEKQASERNEYRMRLMLENSSDLIVDLDVEGDCRWVSPSVTRFLGWSQEEVQGRHVTSFISEEDYRRAADAHNEDDQPFDMLVKCVTADGGFRWMSSHSSPIYTSEGEYEGIVIGLRDEHYKYIAEQALTESERRYRTLAENASDIVFQTKADSTLDWVSPSGTAVLGWGTNDFVGKILNDMVYPEDLPFVLDEIATHKNVRTSFEARFHKADGDHIWMKVNIGPIFDEKTGEYLGRVGSVHDVTETRRAREAVEFQATHDPLTGLLNRAELINQMTLVLSHEPRRGSFLGVIFIDLDGLKYVNDNHGHSDGDKVIVDSANLISGAVRENDIVARLGGDEYVVVLPEVHEMKDVLTVAEKIHAAASRTYLFGKEEVPITLSLGVTMSGECNDAALLVKHADRAMYRGKQSGKAQTIVYDPEIDFTEDNPGTTVIF